MTSLTGKEKCTCKHRIDMHKLDMLKMKVTKTVRVKCLLCDCEDITLL